MNSDNQRNSGRSDEIDIFDFCSRVWKIFQSFVAQIRNFCVSVIVFLIRKSVWIGAFTVIGSVAGLTLYFLSKPVYSTNLVANTSGVSNALIIDHVNQLGTLIKKPEILAGYLGLTVDEAKEIAQIRAYYGMDVNGDKIVDYVDFTDVEKRREKYDPMDTLRLQGYIYLRVSVYRENIFPALRKGIFQYITGNDYIRNTHEITTNQKRKYLEGLEDEIRKIDSLQRFQYQKNISSGKDVLLISSPELKLFHQEMLELYNQKQQLEIDIEMNRDLITIVQDFMPLTPEDRLFSYVGIVGIVGAVLGLICAVFWQYRRVIWLLIKEDSSKNSK
jgi:hypothetical protein